MKTQRLLPLRLACLFLFLTALSGGCVRSAFAQRNPVYLSLEAYANDSDSTYIGTIVKVGEPSPTEAGTPGVRVAIDAVETLKGEKRKSFSVLVYHYPYDHMPDALRAWSRKQTPLLAFIHRSRSDKNAAASPEITASLLPVNPADGTVLTPLPIVGYFSMDFRLLRAPGLILDAVRRYAKNAPKMMPLHSLRYIPDLIRKQFPYNTGGELLVPIVPQLETIATRMILSPASFLPAEQQVKGVSHKEYLAFQGTDTGSLRRIGVEALARFKSDANIALLKRYLNDPFLEAEWGHDRNVYSVRKIAFETLKKWGVTVAEPQLHGSPEDIQNLGL